MATMGAHFGPNIKASSGESAAFFDTPADDMRRGNISIPGGW